MAVRKADRQLLVLLIAALAIAMLWWGFGRAGGGAEGVRPTTSGTLVPATTSGSDSGRPPPGPGSTTMPGDASPGTPVSGLSTIAESQLPVQARDTLGLIRAGGPFPYAEDGDTFENRERILPRRERGYYREYTVETPGSDDRGARRIVSGADDDRYYTDDHYDSFRQIQEGR